MEGMSPTGTGRALILPTSQVDLPQSEGRRFRTAAWRFWAKCLACITLWWTSAILVIMLIKETQNKETGVFPYSVTLTAFTQLVTGVVAWLFSQVLYRHKAALPPWQREECLQVIALGLILGTEIGLTNKALQYLTVASRTMINSTNVFWMMATAWVWRLEKCGCWRTVSCIFLIGGGMLQGLDHAPEADRQVHTLGILMQFASMCISSQRWALMQYVLQRSHPTSALGQMGKCKFQLLSYIMPISGVVLLPVVWLFEPAGLEPEHFLKVDLPVPVFCIAVAVTLMVFAEVQLVGELSAVAFNVLAAIHQIPIVLAGVVLQHDHVSATAAGGFGLCLFGAMVYAWARKVDSERGVGR